jgi:hypothetical protein
VSTAASPQVTGPVTGGQPDVPVNAMPSKLEQQYGYSENEYFIEGTASAYRGEGTWDPNGMWSAVPTTQAHYKTRLLVRAPTDPRRFNGTVVVEWLNESAGRDADPDFGAAYPELMRDGFAYVGVSAQAVGVIGGPPLLAIQGYNPEPLRVQNPGRYESLQHPGDDYSYDIFSQAGQAIRHPDGPSPLGRLVARKLIAAGESQSAFRMVTYVNAIEPMTHVYDAFLIHSRGATGTPLSTGSAQPPPSAQIRADLHQPVLQLETETDLFGLGFDVARQPDTNQLRTWEVAGTSHADQQTIDYGIASGRTWAPGVIAPDFTAMCGRINDGPQQLIVRKAFASLRSWLVDERQPARSAPLQVSGGAIDRDQHGNALGGIRTPAVDAPIETLQGTFDPHKSVICALFGSATPFDARTLRSLYPTHLDYEHDVSASAQSAVRSGFLLPAEATTVSQAANAAPVPS